MGLLPLEFGDCLLDSPYFRENLKSHERQLEETSTSIKELISGIQNVIQCAKNLSDAKMTLARAMENFKFDCLGSTLTDDEIIIASSLKQFSGFFTTMETEIREMIDEAESKFISPLISFRKNQIDNVKQSKKCFDKASKKLCDAQDRYVRSSRKEESLSELSDLVRSEQKNLNSSSLDYVYNVHLVQEKKKFEFVEILLKFTQSWLHYYRLGFNKANDFEQYTLDLDTRVKKARDNYSNTVERYSSLKDKMTQNFQDPGQFNKMYIRQGYLYVQGKKSMKMGQGWYKYFCQLLQVHDNSKRLTLIPYNQTDGKVGQGETISVINCLCKDDIPEKFRFTVTGHDLSSVQPDSNERLPVLTFTLQALTDHERKLWVEALGGSWSTPSTLQRLRADSIEENLNSTAFIFLKDCLEELEHRGMHEVGLYRVDGVTSKVKDFLNQAINPDEPTPDIRDPKAWESKTLASAVKHYLREVPLMTYHLFNQFIEAAKKENDNERVKTIKQVVHELPDSNRQLITILIHHLHKVAENSDKNLMTASNLGVVFGPTLLRPREETCASIVDIKFRNQVIEILIDQAEFIFSDEVEVEVDGGLATPISESSSCSPHLQTRGSETSGSSSHLQVRGSSETSGSSSHLQATSCTHIGASQASCTHVGTSWRSLVSSKASQSNSPGSTHKFEDNEAMSAKSSAWVEKDPPSNKCKRTQSLSELSVNSLPESMTSSTTGRKNVTGYGQNGGIMTGVGTITTRQSPTIQEVPLPGEDDNLGSDRPRSKSYQIEKSAGPMRMWTSMTSSHADLTSSVELMMGLASDLPVVSPMSGTSLRRTSTTNASRSHKSLKQDVTRKPPLPKLGGISSPSCHHPPLQFPVPEETSLTGSRSSPEERQLGGCSTTATSPQENLGELPKFEVSSSGGSSHHNYPHLYHRRASEHSISYLNTKPDKHKRNNSQDSGVLLSPSPQAERRRTLSTNTEGGRSKANSPTPRGERGQTASPSLDRLVHGGGGSGGVGGRFHQSEDNSSLASLSLSESSEASVSRYENTESSRFNNPAAVSGYGLSSSGNGVSSGYHKDYSQHQDSFKSSDNSNANTEADATNEPIGRDQGLTIDEDNLKLLELLRDSPNSHNDSHNKYNYSTRHYDSKIPDPRCSGPYENDEIEQNIYELENVVINHHHTKPVIRLNSLKARKPAKLDVNTDYEGISIKPAKIDGNSHITSVDRKSGKRDDVEISDEHDGVIESGDHHVAMHDGRPFNSNWGKEPKSGDVLTTSLSRSSLKNLLNSSPASNV